MSKKIHTEAVDALFDAVLIHVMVRSADLCMQPG